MRLTPLLFLCISQTIAFAPRFARVATTQRLFSTSEEKNTNTGHQAPADIAAPAMSAENEAKVAALRLHQSGAARLSMADEVRTLIEQSIGYGVMSTNSKAFPGYPTGSVVGFALEEDGKPFFVLSTMSAHTGDILKDGKTSLTVMANDFKGASEGRIVLIGDVVKVFDKEVIANLRTKYFARHPGAYWADFGDFSYFEMKEIHSVRFIGGFAMAGSITGEQYMKGKPDPIAAFAPHVMKHMNDDHGANTISMVKHYVGVDCTEANIVSMDSLGMMVKAKLEIAGGGYNKIRHIPSIEDIFRKSTLMLSVTCHDANFPPLHSKIRLPFPYPVLDRKSIKEVLFFMYDWCANNRI